MSKKNSLHHMLWTRRDWNTGLAHTLRTSHWFQIYLPVQIHRELHEEVDPIPIPSEQDCEEVLRQLELLENTAPKVKAKMRPSARCYWLAAVVKNEATANALIEQANYLTKKGY